MDNKEDLIGMKMKLGLPIGGQALSNGVMIRTHEKYAIALRLHSGRIVSESWPVSQKSIIKRPVLRGIYQLFSSFKTSVQTIFRAIQLSKQAGELHISPLSIISAAVAVLIVGLYAFLTDWLYNYLCLYFLKFCQHYLFTFVYGLANLVMFIFTLFIITSLPAVKRLLRYHGAEHKAIACYEKGLEMTFENVTAQSRFHKRCGTSMVVIIVLAVLVASVFIPQQLPETVQELILCAVVLIAAGLAYEAMRAKKTTLITRLGLFAQRFTTREPDSTMMACAIVAINEAVKSD